MKKQAEDLKRGDLVTGWGDEKITPKFVVSVEPDKQLPNVIVKFAGHGSTETWSSDLEIEVVTGLLTPAQLYADELFTHLDTLLETNNHGGRLATEYANEIQALLDRIKPPTKPSPDELMVALARLTNAIGTPDEAAARAAAMKLTERR
jgi:hypothetical protein